MLLSGFATERFFLESTYVLSYRMITRNTMTSLKTAIVPSSLSILSLISVGLFLVLAVLLQRFCGRTKHTRLANIPVVGRYWRWEPEFITKYRFVTHGWDIVHEGWSKVINEPVYYSPH